MLTERKTSSWLKNENKNEVKGGVNKQNMGRKEKEGKEDDNHVKI